MLYPAQLYKEELKRKLISCWYDPKYKYYFAGDRHEFTIPDNTDWREDFVHLSESGEVDGFFSYNYDDGSKSMRNFGLISFCDNGLDLVQDAIDRIKYMIACGVQRLEFFAFADNPICKLYNYYIKRYGGEQVCRLHRVAFFDGEYHDSVLYEMQGFDHGTVLAPASALISSDIKRLWKRYSR